MSSVRNGIGLSRNFKVLRRGSPVKERGGGLGFGAMAHPGLARDSLVSHGRKGGEIFDRESGLEGIVGIKMKSCEYRF